MVDNIQRGGIVVSPNRYLESPVPIYRTDISIHPSLQGKGVGAMLYVLAARTVHRLGGVMHSGGDASRAARDTLKNLERSGWVKETTAPDQGRALMNVKNQAFIFRQSLLRNGFFNPTDTLLSGFDEVEGLVPLDLQIKPQRPADLSGIPD